MKMKFMKWLLSRKTKCVGRMGSRNYATEYQDNEHWSKSVLKETVLGVNSTLITNTEMSIQSLDKCINC